MCRKPEVAATDPRTFEPEKRINTLLKGQMVREVAIHSSRELVIFFESGARLFVNAGTELEFSVT